MVATSVPIPCGGLLHPAAFGREHVELIFTFGQMRELPLAQTAEPDAVDERFGRNCFGPCCQFGYFVRNSVVPFCAVDNPFEFHKVVQFDPQVQFVRAGDFVKS